MSKIHIIAPDWGNSWLPIYQQMMEASGHTVRHITPEEKVESVPDQCLFMWARNHELLSRCGRNIMFMRGYDFLDYYHWQNLPWDRIQHLILCNPASKASVDDYFMANHILTKTHLVFNAVDTSGWTYKERSHGHKIGMVCHIHLKKNIPLALYILEALPGDYELHIAGAVQDQGLLNYIVHMGNTFRRKVFIYGHIPREHLDEWWEDKNYCLSTSISEGNPNNVLEAMAKGIKPVVHAWPGADAQFKGVFHTVAEAAAEILRGGYDSAAYLEQIRQNHSLTNYEKIVKIVNNQ